MIKINTKLTDRERVTQFLMSRAPCIGAGEDPIGFLMASYVYVIHEKNNLVAREKELLTALESISKGIDTFHISDESGMNITVEDSSRFAHERDVVELLSIARTAFARAKEI